MKNQKAQISLEYFVSLLIFVSLLTFVIFELRVITPDYLREVKTQTLRLETFQISELLINDAGEPDDWDERPPPETLRVGLSNLNSQDEISIAKIVELDSRCKSAGGYQNLYDWLGMQNQFYLAIQDENGYLLNTRADCPPVPIIGRPTVMLITRVVTLDTGNFANLTLTVW